MLAIDISPTLKTLIQAAPLSLQIFCTRMVGIDDDDDHPLSPSTHRYIMIFSGSILNLLRIHICIYIYMHIIYDYIYIDIVT